MRKGISYFSVQHPRRVTIGSRSQAIAIARIKYGLPDIPESQALRRQPLQSDGRQAGRLIRPIVDRLYKASDSWRRASRMRRLWLLRNMGCEVTDDEFLKEIDNGCLAGIDEHIFEYQVRSTILLRVVEI